MQEGKVKEQEVQVVEGPSKLQDVVGDVESGRLCSNGVSPGTQIDRQQVAELDGGPWNGSFCAVRGGRSTSVQGRLTGTEADGAGCDSTLTCNLAITSSLLRLCHTSNLLVWRYKCPNGLPLCHYALQRARRVP